MNQRRHLTVIAAAATLMAAMPLEILFAEWTWIFQCFALVAIICGAALAGRSLRAPVWAQPLIGLAALVIGLTWIHAGSAHALGGLIPDGDTFRYFGRLISSAGTDINQMAIPVDNTPSLLFLTSAGIGACAVLVDLLAVGLRKPALAGLPMLAIYTVPLQIDRNGISFIPFVIGACGFLWLLISDSIDRVRMFGRRFTGDGRGVDAWETSPLSSIGRRIATVGVVLAVAVPVIMPGIGNGVFASLGTNGNGSGGNGQCRGVCPHSNEVDLFASTAGSLHNGKPTNELTVTTSDPLPFYLRYAVAGDLEKDGFHETVPTGSDSQTDPAAQQISGATFARFHASVVVDQFQNDFLPDYYNTVLGSLNGVGNAWHYNDDTQTIYSNGVPARGARYSFDFARIAIADPTVLRSASKLADTDPIEVKYASTPKPLPPSVTEWLAANTTPGESEYDTVNALYYSLGPSNHFVYKLTTNPGTTGSDIGDFLQQRQGFCVQYAATLAWLVRAAGFPARVAFGFTQGTLLGRGTYSMTDHDLHAWTEVYFPGYGWLPWDATPASGINGAVATTWAPGTNHQPNGGEVSSAPHPSSGPQSGGVRPTSVRSSAPHIGATSSGHHKATKTPPWVWWSLLAVLVIVLVVISPAIARVMIRRRRTAIEHRFASVPIGEPTVVTDDATEYANRLRHAHTAWDEFMDTLVDFDVSIDLTETPQTTAARVVATTELTREAVQGVLLVGATEQQARYARRPVAAGDLDGELRRFRRELGANVPFSTRLRAVVFPPSVTIRWRAAAGERAARMSAATQAFRERIGRTLNLRWLSPRRLIAGRGSR
jgi:hypothetical protein